uniref:Proteasome assembly chaperone 4-like protein n=1 Tax=Acartia pacifica TaxID=335913 RepID=A0A0U2LF80_ACAPC|nr:proteasome assembly chaperone 4-like protein [Acartia pacifica]
MPVPTDDTACSLKTHNFGLQILDKSILFQVLQMSEQLYIWIGEGNGELQNLSVGVPVQGGAASSIFGGGDQSRQLADRLSGRLKKQVWVSFSTCDDILTTPAILERLITEIKEHPDKF